MKKKENKKALPQAEVKKNIGRDECLKEIVDAVSIVAKNYYGKDKISPMEMTFSQEINTYVTNHSTGDVYDARVNDNGIMLATYRGYSKPMKGHIYIQCFKDIFLPCISQIQDDNEFEAAKDMLRIDTIEKKYFQEAHKLLKLAVPEADLVVWTSDITRLHITDLNQDHEFKRMLKINGLI